MDTAFPYSQYVTGKNFVGRRADVTLMGNLLSQGENILLSEPPKSGKTSLVQQALLSMRMSGKVFSVGQFSALNIRTPEAFLLKLGNTVLRMTASGPAEYAALCRKYLEGTHFVFDSENFTEENQILSLGWDLDEADVRAMLRFPYILAQERGERIILIIDEFQSLAHLENPDVLFRPMDACMRELRDGSLFSWIICGSGVNAMKGIFSSSLLFHRQLERVRLSPVDEREMADHVHKGFTMAGKVVSKELLQGACRLFRGHLWYINHFVAICDAMSKGYIVEQTLVEALNTLVAIHEPRFNAVMEDLTTHQISLLKAIVDGVVRFSSADVIRKYGLNSSANVKRVKDALTKKEVLVFDENDAPQIIDPLFEYWVRNYYFEMKD
ncbi:MAG: ATP-binding protein [Bacteroidales bacterium]|nr:ATP-binding protein [Bacteroidales bacterium]